MRHLFFIFILLNCLNHISVNGQEVVRHRYSADNLKITEYDILDTVKVLMKQFDDNYCYYLSKNDDNEKFDVNIKLKTARFTTQWMNSVDEDGTKNFIRDTFKVDYIDNKAFIISPDLNKKYLVYKFYAYKNDTRLFIYWSREFGVILEKYLDHNMFLRNELLNEETKNKTLLQLVLLTLGDTNFSTDIERKI